MTSYACNVNERAVYTCSGPPFVPEGYFHQLALGCHASKRQATLYTSRSAGSLSLSPICFILVYILSPVTQPTLYTHAHMCITVSAHTVLIQLPLLGIQYMSFKDPSYNPMPCSLAFEVLREHCHQRHRERERQKVSSQACE